jgi:hypothetical protein
MKKSLLSLVLILVLGIALSACATRKSVTRDNAPGEVVLMGDAYGPPAQVIIDGGAAYGFPINGGDAYSTSEKIVDGGKAAGFLLEPGM